MSSQLGRSWTQVVLALLPQVLSFLAGTSPFPCVSIAFSSVHGLEDEGGLPELRRDETKHSEPRQPYVGSLVQDRARPGDGPWVR